MPENLVSDNALGGDQQVRSPEMYALGLYRRTHPGSGRLCQTSF